MPTNLEFRGCPNCGKSIPVQARECYRCHSVVQPISAASRSAPTISSSYKNSAEEDSGTAHGALSSGGYESDYEDFDYEEYVKREFSEVQNKRRSFRWYVIWLLVVAMSFPLVATALQLVFGS